MPSGPADIGITSAAATLLQAIEYERSVTEKVRKNSVGGFAVGTKTNPKNTGSLTLLGTSATTVGVAASGITGIATGVTVFTEVTHTQVNEDYDETQSTFVNAPSAATGAPG